MKRLQKMTFLTWAWCLGLLLASSISLPAQKKKAGKNNQPTEEISKKRSQAEAEYYMIEGMKFFVLENYPKALEKFEKARGYLEKAPAIDYKIAETYTQLNSLPQAETYAQKALEEDKNNPYFYILLAKIYERQAKLDLAAQTYKAMLDADIGAQEYYYDLANIYEQKQELNKAIDTFNKLEEKFGTDEQTIRRKQQIYMQLGQSDKAIEEGEKLIAAQPQDPRHVVSLSEMLIANKQTEAALPILEAAAQQKTLDPRVYLLLAKIYREKGEISKSLAQLKIAFANPELSADDKVKTVLMYIQEDKEETDTHELIQLTEQIIKGQPAYPAVYVLYGDLLLKQNNREAAKQKYLKATSLDTDIHPRIWQQILTIETEASQMDSLAKHAEAALELYPNQAVFWLYLSIAQLGKKDYEAAVEAIEEGKRMAFNQEDLKLDLLTMLGDAYQGLEEYEASNRAYEEALSIDPNHERTLNNYSFYLALRKENLPKAKAMATQLIEKYPENATYLDTYAWVLYAQKDYKKARKALEKALQFTQSGTILEHYGDVLYQLGEEEEALKQWQRAKEKGKTSGNIDKKISNKKLYE